MEKQNQNQEGGKGGHHPPDVSVVKPVEIDESKLNKIEHGIFTFPSMSLLVGQIASGKSTLLHHLISKYFEPVFEDRVILFSPSARNDPIMNDLIENDKVFIHFPVFNMDIMDKVLEVIKDDDDPSHRYLIVIDDAQGSIPPTMSKEGVKFNKFIANFRHTPKEGKISIIIAIQKFSSINNFVRANLHYIFLLGRVSEKELKQYSEEMNAITSGDDKKFLEIYHKGKENMYDFVLLDFKKMRVLKNLNTLLYDLEGGETLEEKGEDGDTEITLK